MRKENYKGRCEKRKLSKCLDVCKTYDAIQYAYADVLEADNDIIEIRCNVQLEGLEFTSDFVCLKANGEYMVRERRLQQILNKMKKQEQKIYAIEKVIVKLEKDLKEVKKKWFHRKEQKELEGKIDAKKAQLEKVKDILDLIPAQHGYQNALEVTKAMKAARVELKKVQMAQKAWDAPEPEPEKMYLSILANIPNVEKQ